MLNDPDKPVPPEPGQDEIRQYLSNRADPAYLEKRLHIEQLIEDAHVDEHGSIGKKIKSTRWQVNNLLKISLLGKRARRNALDLELIPNDIYIPGLPDNLHGLKILHLSDLHIECVDGLLDRVINIVKNIHADITVITGDIRSRSFGPVQPSLQMMSAISQHIKGDCYAVAGNHDSIRMIPALESMGIQVLLNESVTVTIKQQSISIIGVDDPGNYRCDDLPRALKAADISKHSPDLTILLAHSPDCIDEASQAELDIYLCGHTHGGQVCLPGGFPLHRTAGRYGRYCSGAWKKAAMSGYTSRGIGTSIAPARFNCPPEITMHTIHRTAATD